MSEYFMSKYLMSEDFMSEYFMSENFMSEYFMSEYFMSEYFRIRNRVLPSLKVFEAQPSADRSQLVEHEDIKFFEFGQR